MSLSDCPKCWDTPCVCGHEGYLTFWLDAPTKAQHNHDVLVKALSTLPDDVFELLVTETTALRIRSQQNLKQLLLNPPTSNPYDQMSNLRQKSEENTR